MAWRIVLQPNGLLARFSEVVDTFTHYDMTREEAVDLCREYLGRRDAEEKVQRAIDAPERFKEALDTITIIHGRRAASKARKLAGSIHAPR